MSKNQKIIAGLFIIQIVVMLVLDFTDKDDRIIHVAVDMLWYLILFWVVIGGTTMYILRHKFYNFYAKIRWPFWLKFTLFSTLLAMLEEFIAVSINNKLSPLTGGQAKLTASTNYWEVVSQHSVVAFIPLFMIFGFLINKYKWTQFKTFLTFGIVGVLAEYTVSEAFSFIMFSLWIFVYGLMVYLPSRNDG
jgi:hypothetical protein